MFWVIGWRAERDGHEQAVENSAATKAPANPHLLSPVANVERRRCHMPAEMPQPAADSRLPARVAPNPSRAGTESFRSRRQRHRPGGLTLSGILTKAVTRRPKAFGSSALDKIMHNPVPLLSPHRRSRTRQLRVACVSLLKASSGPSGRAYLAPQTRAPPSRSARSYVSTILYRNGLVGSHRAAHDRLCPLCLRLLYPPFSCWRRTNPADAAAS